MLEQYICSVRKFRQLNIGVILYKYTEVVVIRKQAESVALHLMLVFVLLNQNKRFVFNPYSAIFFGSTT
jgi:hypothetical protein